MKSFLVVVGILFLAAAGDNLSEVFEKMKSSREQVEQMIQNNLGYGSYGYPGACSLIPAAGRAAVVNAVGQFAKAYTRSDAFLTWYREFREGRKPSQPELGKPMAEIRKEQIEQMKQSLAEQEEAAKSASGDMKKMYREIIETTKQTMKQLQSADPAQDAMMDQYTKQANESIQQEYSKKLAEYERDFPVDNPKPLLKRRLQEFLDATAGIDYAAKLVKKEKVTVFENPAYEKKDDRWKRGFRAGKEATEAARAIAREWLKELK